MRNQLSFVVCLVVCAVGCGSGSTSGATPRALAVVAVKNSLDQGGFEALTNQAVSQSVAVAKAGLQQGGTPLTLEQNRAIEAVMRRVLLEVFPRAAWEEALLPLFLDKLSAKELEEIVAFQATQPGQKLLNIQSRLVTGGGSIGEQLLKSREEEFTRRLAAELALALKSPQ